MNDEKRRITMKQYANLEKYNDKTNRILTHINSNESKKRMTYSERVAVYMMLLEEQTDDAFQIFTNTMQYIERT